MKKNSQNENHAKRSGSNTKDIKKSTTPSPLTHPSPHPEVQEKQLDEYYYFHKT